MSRAGVQGGHRQGKQQVVWERQQDHDEGRNEDGWTAALAT